MVVPKLVLSNFVSRKARVVLTVAAIALSVSLVVSVTSGYKSAEGAAHQFLTQYLGSTDAQIKRQDGREFDAALVAEMMADPDVNQAIGRLEVQSVVLDSAGEPIPNR